jgi:hypothetical protein
MPMESAPVAAAEDDFAAFLSDMAPPPAVEPPSPAVESPSPAVEEPSPSAEEPPVEGPWARESSAEEPPAMDWSAAEPSPAMDWPPAEPEAAAAEIPAVEDELFPVAESSAADSAPAEAVEEPAWTPDAVAPDAAPAAEADGFDDLLFAPKPTSAETPMIETPVSESPAEVAAPAEDVLAEAPPIAAPTVRPYFVDVDTRLTASHRAFARVAVKTPRMEVPYMEPDMPAGRNFHRSGPAAVSVAAPSPPVDQPVSTDELVLSEAPAPVEETPAPVNLAEEFTATSDDVVTSPPKQADAELDDFLNDLGMGDEPNRPR